MELVLMLAIALAAAPQLPDHLVVEGRSEALVASPLQAALDADAQLHGRLKRYFSQKPCPELERGYRATWELREGALLLVKLDVDPCGGGKTVPLSLVFPNATGPVKATWFSGELRTDPGRVRYVKSGTVTGEAKVERPRRQY